MKQFVDDPVDEKPENDPQEMPVSPLPDLSPDTNQNPLDAR